jgi:hypothetical protein
MCNNSGPLPPPASLAASTGARNFPSSRNALTLCIVIKLDALGDNKIIGSRFFPELDEDELAVVDVTEGTPFKRERKYCFAEREIVEKSVGFVPRRIVIREVIVRSLEWIRKTA